MGTFQITKGRDLKIKGAAAKEIVQAKFPPRVAVQPPDFKGMKARPAVKVGDYVKVGTTLLIDKTHPDIKVVSPASGKIAAVNRGDKRILLDIIVETDGKQDVEVFDSFSKPEISSLMKEKVVKLLMDGGLWPTIRQRPFSKIANPEHPPKAIFVHATSTEPLAPDVDFILQGKEDLFQTGLDIIKKLTDGDVHLCISALAKSKALTDAKNVQIHGFSGPHPAGNVSTHVHHINPINKGDVIWYIEAQDVLKIAFLFLNGVYSPEQIVAVAGEEVSKRAHFKTIVGAPLSILLEGSDLAGKRCLSGSVLTGKNVGPGGFVRYYDSQVSVVREGGERKLLGWMTPGFNSCTFSNTFMSALMGDREFSLDTDKNGSDRAIVLNDVYDQYVPLDIMTYFLIKAVLSGDVEEAEKLGILECDEEDFALCTFACPSKTEVGEIIRQGLDVIEREG